MYKDNQVHAEISFQALMQDPYRLIMEEGGLIKYKNSLQQFSPHEKTLLASKLILTCPSRKLPDLDLKVSVLRDEHPLSFYSKVRRALTVRAEIMRMLDYSVQEPHQLFFKPGVYPDLFNEFHLLSKELVDRYPVDFASSLASKAPSDSLSALAQQVQVVFSQTMFAAALNEALILRRTLDQLNSQEAYGAFINGEFNAGSFKKFQDMATAYLNDPQTIARNLTQTPEKYTEEVVKCLSELKTAFENVEDNDLKTNIGKLNASFSDWVESKKEFRFAQAEAFFKQPLQQNPNNNSDQPPQQRPF